MSHKTEVMAICVRFCLFWLKFGCHGNVPYTLAIRIVFCGLADNGNLYYKQSHSHYLLRKCICINFSPKIGCQLAMVTSLCPLCTEVSKMNSAMAQTLSQNQTLHGSHIQLKLWLFLWFLAYFGQNLVAVERPLDPCNQKCLLSIGRPRKPPL